MVMLWVLVVTQREQTQAAAAADTGAATVRARVRSNGAQEQPATPVVEVGRVGPMQQLVS